MENSKKIIDWTTICWVLSFFNTGFALLILFGSLLWASGGTDEFTYIFTILWAGTAIMFIIGNLIRNYYWHKQKFLYLNKI